MPEKTNAEWHALDARIAREVMEWKEWEVLSEEARKAHWTRIGEEPDNWNLAYYREKWWFLDESERADWEYSIDDWRPHECVAQALMAADKICDQGWDRELTRPGAAQKRYASFWKYRPMGRDTFDGCAETDAKAICLAIGNFREANC